MGWTETHKPKGEPLADCFHRHGATRWSEDSPYRYRVLASALVHASTWYAAVERVEKTTGERIVFALIFLVRMYKAKHPGGYNFGYKDMSEDMGPIEARCPERILDLLTPTESAHANAWRAACRRYHATRKLIPRMAPGTVLRFTEPLIFGAHGKATEFTVLRTSATRLVCSAAGLSILAAVPRSLVRKRLAASGVTFS
ncbi:DUF6927 domain-containing protein [Cupriavidus sp. 30B13]|uniref:DUF6927 domain-containing protein n=1 Tax=Cupriavidus sp. 30B13 TaxID=3384241 RepID=UPI003B8FBFBA